MDFPSLIGLVNSFCILLLGIFVFAGDRKGSNSKSFLFMSASIAIWSFGYAIWLLQTEEESALFWSKILNLGATLIPASFLYWVLNFLNLAGKRKKMIFFSIGLTVFFCLCNFLPSYIESVGPAHGFPFWQKAGPLYIYFIIFGYFGLIGCGLYELLRLNGKEENADKRKQIQLIIPATLIVSAAGATNFLLMYDIDLLPPLAQPFSLLYPLVFLIATIKYRLFDVKLILTEFLVGLMGSILLIFPFLMSTDLQRILSSVLLILFCLVGDLLIRSTLKESHAKEILEQEVGERTKELKESNDQLKKFYNVAIGRELKMAELKKDMENLKRSQ
jgi:hypothetical protein